MDSKIHTMIMSSILAFSLIAGIPTVFAQNDTGMTSGGGDMGNMTQAQGENMTQAQGGEMGMTDGQNGDDGDNGGDEDKDDGGGDEDKDDGGRRRQRQR